MSNCPEDHISRKVRTKYEVRADMLRIAETGANKTRVVYGSNLNFEIVKGHLNELIKTGRMFQRGKKFYTTPIGLEYVRHVEALI